jgi:hypothetical protein
MPFLRIIQAWYSTRFPSTPCRAWKRLPSLCILIITSTADSPGSYIVRDELPSLVTAELPNGSDLQCIQMWVAIMALDYLYGHGCCCYMAPQTDNMESMNVPSKILRNTLKYSHTLPPLPIVYKPPCSFTLRVRVSPYPPFF